MSLNCTVISIDSPHMHRDGAGKSILPLDRNVPDPQSGAVLHLSSCLSDDTLSSNVIFNLLPYLKKIHMCVRDHPIDLHKPAGKPNITLQK